MKRFAFFIGLFVGYILGTRAGRARYNQIAKIADKVWHTSIVQKGVACAKDASKGGIDTAKDKAIDVVSGFLKSKKNDQNKDVYRVEGRHLQADSK